MNGRLGILVLAGIICSCSQASIYVSSSRGDDANDGKRPCRAVRTISRACSLGSDIRLRRGDVFYERITRDSISISPYGCPRAPKPVLSGFIRIDSGKWERGSFDPAGIWAADPEGSIYRLNVIEAASEDGFNDPAASGRANIGLIYDPSSGVIYGRKCQAQNEDVFRGLEYQTGTSYRWPVRDMDFYQKNITDRNDPQLCYVYVLASNPSMLLDRELWMSAGATAISGSDKSIRNIKIQGWGAHGAAVRRNMVIDGCEFDMIGGSFLLGYGHWVRYGNGVEFWATDSRNSTVSNCLFSRIYDTGTTIQGPMYENSYCDSIVFTGNTFRGCRQDFEVWIDSNCGNMPTRCTFTGNKGYDSGNNGFESEEQNNTHLLHYPKVGRKIRGITIEDNEFFGGEGLYFSRIPDNMPIGRNTYHCAPGAPILKTADLIVYAPEDASGLESVKARLTELTGNPDFELVLDL